MKLQTVAINARIFWFNYELAEGSVIQVNFVLYNFVEDVFLKLLLPDECITYH